MKKALTLLCVSTVALGGSTGAIAVQRNSEVQSQQVREIRDLSFELVGQFQNSAPGVTPLTHVHYGYVSYIRGVQVFARAPQDETTALFTFFAEAATPRVIVNGPLRVITRVGKVTIYQDPATNSDFAKPASFADGTPVLVAGFRQQVVTNTVTGSFTALHQNTIVSTAPFESAGTTVHLGRVGQTFRTSLSGHVTMPGPPSGYFSGYAVSG